jgi:hypothetical protein
MKERITQKAHEQFAAAQTQYTALERACKEKEVGGGLLGVCMCCLVWLVHGPGAGEGFVRRRGRSVGDCWWEDVLGGFFFRTRRRRAFFLLIRLIRQCPSPPIHTHNTSHITHNRRSRGGSRRRLRRPNRRPKRRSSRRRR